MFQRLEISPKKISHYNNFIYNMLSEVTQIGLVIVLLNLALIVNSSSNDDDGQCIWYGVCYYNDYNLASNCAYNGKGKQVSDPESRDILRQYCPDIYQNGEKMNTFYYVTLLQIFRFQKQILT